MFGYQGEFQFGVFIERKPEPEGMRSFIWCYQLTQSGRPVCYRYLPDLTIPHIGGAQILSDMLENKPSTATGIILCADAFFTSLEWAQNHPEQPVIFSIPRSKIDDVFEIFTYQLSVQEYRVFAKGPILLSVWHDNAIVTCASTIHTWTPNPEGHIRGHVMITLNPWMSLKGVETLQQLSGPDLEGLCRRLNLPASSIIFSLFGNFPIWDLYFFEYVGGTKQEMACRIAGRTPQNSVNSIPYERVEREPEAITARIEHLENHYDRNELMERCKQLGLAYSEISTSISHFLF